MKIVVRKLLSVMLMLCLLTLLLPFPATAADEDVCQIPETGVGYTTLDGALTAVQSGQTIRLLKDINYNSGIAIVDKSITFNLNGFILNVVNTAGGDTYVENCGLYVEGNAAISLDGLGEFNVTGTWYGVFAECNNGESAQVTVTNATGNNGRDAVAAQRSKVTVKGNATSNGEGCRGVRASYENGEVIVEGNVYANGGNSCGVYAEDLGKVTIKGSVTVTGYNSRGIYAYHDGKAAVGNDIVINVEKDITASGTGSIGVQTIDSNITVGGNVAGEYGGIDASGSDVDVTGDVQSTGSGVNTYGVTATNLSEIIIGGDVRSNEIGAYIWSEDGETPSMITINGVIGALKYVKIGSKTLAFTNGSHEPSLIQGYIIYEDTGFPEAGAIHVAEFAGGDGNQLNPYLIAHADHLYNVRNHLDKHFRQIADVDLSDYKTGEGWNPIGTTSNSFIGTYDGDGFTVRNLFINKVGAWNVRVPSGLFGYTVAGAEIRNLKLESVDITGCYYVGSIVGSNSGKITGVISSGTVTGEFDTGGLVGVSGKTGSITDSSFTGTVTGTDDIEYGEWTGGLVGYNLGSITNCQADVTVVSEYRCVGGLVGENLEEGIITGSYSAGTVTADDYTGGLIGANSGEITMSHSICTVNGDSDVGGLAGNNGGLITSCYSTGKVIGLSNVGGLAGYSSGPITSCYSTSAVDGYLNVGGLVGSNIVPITGSYSVGKVIGNINMGGLVGYDLHKESTDCYWDKETSCIEFSRGGTGKTTAEMKQQLTFANWDFIALWDMNAVDNSGYPFLRYQINIPPILSEIGVDSTTDTSVAWRFTSDKTGVYYYLVYEKVKAAPNTADIKAQGSESVANGTGPAAAAINNIMVTGLTALTEYRIYIIVEYSEMNTSAIEVINFNTLPIATVPAAPQNFVAMPGDGLVVLNWDAPLASIVTKYQVSKDNGTNWTDVGLNTTYTFTELVNSTAYTFKVRAINTIGDGVEASISATPATVPLAPQNFNALPGDGQMVLSWTAPTSDGGSAITKYQVSKDNGANWMDVGLSTTYTFTGLTNGAAYTFKVRAINTIGDGVEASISATPATVPSAPQNFNASPGDGQVVLSWTAPTSDGGSAITKYQVSKDNGTNWMDVGLFTTYTFTGLTNGTAYTFKVRAINTIGDGVEASISATPIGVVSYSITVHNDGNGTATADFGSATQNMIITLTAAPNDGYRFKEWQVISGDISIVNNKFTMPAKNVTVKIIFEPILASTYIVTVNGSYAVTTGAGSYAKGSTVTIYAGSRNGYTFAGWTFSDGVNLTNANNIITTFPMPDKNVTIEANWSFSSDGDSDTSTTPPYMADIKTEDNTEMKLPVMVNANTGTASVDAGFQGMGHGETVITLPSVPNVDTYSVGIPVTELSTVYFQGTLTVNTDKGSVTVPSNMMTGVSGISGNRAQIAIGEGNKNNLPADVKAAIGDRPLIQLTLSIDGKRADWSNSNAPVTVSIPYNPTAMELANPESIVVWYIDGIGKVVTIPNGRYDPVTGMVTFDITHFSNYAVAYNNVSFKDVANKAWYAKAVSFLAARKITIGIGEDNFGPEVKLTRGQFIVMLMKAYDIAQDANPKVNFSDAGDTYYTGYLSAAKRLGISVGIGNNRYAPENEITRQEMFTLMYNALLVIGRLPQGDSGKTLSDFSDAGQIASWAKEAMTLLVKTGIIEGNAGKLNPKNTITRAEMAQALYNSLRK